MLKNKQIEVKELKGRDLIVSRLKVVKNEVEVSGLRDAYIRESASLVSVYARLKQLIDTNGKFEEHNVD